MAICCQFLPFISQKSKWWILHCVLIESHPLEFKVYATADLQLTSPLWPRYNNITVCVNTAPRPNAVASYWWLQRQKMMRAWCITAPIVTEKPFLERRNKKNPPSPMVCPCAFETFMPKRKPTFRYLLWTWAKTDLNRHRAQPRILLLKDWGWAACIVLFVVVFGSWIRNEQRNSQDCSMRKRYV